MQQDEKASEPKRKSLSARQKRDGLGEAKMYVSLHFLFCFLNRRMGCVRPKCVCFHFFLVLPTPDRRLQHPIVQIEILHLFSLAGAHSRMCSFSNFLSPHFAIALSCTSSHVAHCRLCFRLHMYTYMCTHTCVCTRTNTCVCIHMCIYTHRTARERVGMMMAKAQAEELEATDSDEEAEC